MPDFACPQCGHQIQTTASMAGKRGRCPQCQSALTVPAQATPSQSAQPTPIAHQNTQQAPHQATSQAGQGYATYPQSAGHQAHQQARPQVQHVVVHAAPYGQAGYQAGYQGPPKPLGTPGLAIAGMCVGLTAMLIGLIPFFACFAYLTAFVGLVLSAVGFGFACSRKKGIGIGVTGIVASLAAFVIPFLMAALFVSSIAGAAATAAKKVNAAAQRQNQINRQRMQNRPGFRTNQPTTTVTPNPNYKFKWPPQSQPKPEKASEATAPATGANQR